MTISATTAPCLKCCHFTTPLYFHFIHIQHTTSTSFQQPSVGAGSPAYQTLPGWQRKQQKCHFWEELILQGTSLGVLHTVTWQPQSYQESWRQGQYLRCCSAPSKEGHVNIFGTELYLRPAAAVPEAHSPAYSEPIVGQTELWGFWSDISKLIELHQTALVSGERGTCFSSYWSFYLGSLSLWALAIFWLLTALRAWTVVNEQELTSQVFGLPGNENLNWLLNKEFLCDTQFKWSIYYERCVRLSHRQSAWCHSAAATKGSLNDLEQSCSLGLAPRAEFFPDVVKLLQSIHGEHQEYGRLLLLQLWAAASPAFSRTLMPFNHEFLQRGVRG